ncbi:MAG TPA: YdeI/OmpD-associated family protein [Membranihabitans sp.]|nr:YdeI/OmpD-associated family protein [Membranihabitans sp.]
MNPKTDFFFQKDSQWKKEYAKLRQLCLDSGLTEELKWGVPCYTWKEKNVVLIHGFKEYCALLFHKGVLLDDPENLLIQQTENVQSARQMRFTRLKDIVDMEDVIKKYLGKAIEVEKSGQTVELKKTKEYAVPEEFQSRLDENPSLKDSFNSLTPGRQRGYLLYFSSAKRSETREARVEKYIPKIMDGLGLDD